MRPRTCWSRLRTEASYRSSPTWTTSPPMSERVDLQAEDRRPAGQAGQPVAEGRLLALVQRDGRADGRPAVRFWRRSQIVAGLAR